LIQYLIIYIAKVNKQKKNKNDNHLFLLLVPLPVPFTYNLSSNLLTVIADPPPLMNLNSTYEFQLKFYDKNNESISYERIKISDLQSKLNSRFYYGIIPNLKHTIIFRHIVDSIGYAQSNVTIPPSFFYLENCVFFF